MQLRYNLDQNLDENMWNLGATKMRLRCNLDVIQH